MPGSIHLPPGPETWWLRCIRQDAGALRRTVASRGGKYGQNALEARGGPAIAVRGEWSRVHDMPSLLRLLVILGLLGGVAYAAMFALANFVQPKPREITVTIPQDRLAKPH